MCIGYRIFSSLVVYDISNVFSWYENALNSVIASINDQWFTVDIPFSFPVQDLKIDTENLPQVTRSVDTQHGQLSPQEQRTIDAIVKAR